MNTSVDNKTELAQFLEAKIKEASYREVEELTSVPRSTLSKIVHGQLKGLPELETLIKLSLAYGLPLWRLVEMAGTDIGLAQTTTEQARRVAVLAEAYPEEMKPLLDRLLRLEPNDLRGVVAYLEAVLQR